MTKKYYLQDLKRLKEERGEVNDELMKSYKYNKQLIDTVRDEIKKNSGPTSVDDLSQNIDYPKNEIFFAIMALRMYNQLQIVNKRGEFPTFAFEEVPN